MRNQKLRTIMEKKKYVSKIHMCDRKNTEDVYTRIDIQCHINLRLTRKINRFLYIFNNL
jgi:hypothetical protein